MFKPTILSIGAAALIAGCTSTPRHFKSLANADLQDARIGVNLYVTEAQKPTPKAPTAFDLSEDAQAAYIEKSGTTIAEVQAALAARFQQKPEQPAIDTSAVNFSRTLNFSIIGRNFLPADRLDSAEVITTLVGDGAENWEFKDWRDYEDKNRQVKVAQITRTQELEAGNETDIDFLGSSVLGTEVSASQSTEAKQDLEFEVVENIPSLDENKATFYLDAPFPQINLTGTYAITLDLEPAEGQTVTVPFYRFDTDEGKESASQYYAEFVRNADSDILVKVEMPYAFRHVVENGDTIEENDDIVEMHLVDGEDSKSGEGCANASAGTGALARVSCLEVPSSNDKVIIAAETSTIQALVYFVQIVDPKGVAASRPVKLFDPSRFAEAKYAHCIASDKVAELRKFINWVKGSPSDRTKFEREDQTVFELVARDSSGNYPAITAQEVGNLQIMPVALNYTHRVIDNPAPSECGAFDLSQS